MSRQSLIRCFTRFIVLPILITNLFSCVSQDPEPAITSENRFSTITLISPADIVQFSAPDTHADRAKEGTISGSAAGSLGGILVGATACGPYLYGLCVVGLGAAGLLAGGTAGSLYGFSGISGKSAELLEDQLIKMNERVDLPSQLVARVRRLVPGEMLSGPETADLQAVFTIDAIEIAQEDQNVFLEMRVRLTFATTESRRRPHRGFRDFAARSNSSDLNTWLEPESTVLEASIEQCLAQIGDQIAVVLREHWSPV